MWGVERDADDVGGFVKARRCSWWVRREGGGGGGGGVWCVVCGVWCEAWRWVVGSDLLISFRV